MKLTADKFFMIPLGVAVVAAGLLTYRHLIGTNLSSTYTQSTASSTVQNARYQAMANTQQQLAQTVKQASTPTRVASAPIVPIKKMRPKSGDNNWFVGTEAKADTANLDDVIRNMSEGDTISVGTGTFEFRFREANLPKVEIKGDGGTILKLVRTYARDKGGELSLSNLILTNSDTYLFIDDEFTKLSLNQVTIRSPLKFSFRNNIELNVKDSNFSGTEFILADHTKALFENVKMTSASTFIQMEGFADVEVKGGSFDAFSFSAFSSRSNFVKFKAEGMTLTKGKYGFYGSFNATDTNLKNNDISRLYSVSDDQNNVVCNMCVIENIERVGRR